MRRGLNYLLLLVLALVVNSASAQSITNPITALKNHITGVAPLTAAQIVTQGNSIQSSIRQVGTNSVALAAALDLVSTYDSIKGALFTTSTTKNGFTRDGAGFELEQAMFDLEQGILDYAYTPANLVNYFSLLNDTKFNTCFYFPGYVAPPASTNAGYEVLINASQPKAWGSPVLYDDYAARRPTGCYLAPGSIAYVTVPAALVNRGYNVRVEAHSWDLKAKTTLKRLDRVSLVYPITSATTRIANPLGGGIYIEVPYQVTNGIVTVAITNVVRSPFFSATSFHQTTEAEWLVERSNPGKWADFESDKFMMQVPRSWIYNYDYTNAVKVMQDWDKAMDAVSDLMGRPEIMPKTVMYAQPDVLYRTTVNAPGYPMSNDPYNPNNSENGNKDIYFLTGPQDSAWTTLHELGHAQSFTKFTGETESAVNLLYVAVMNQKFGVPLGTALGESIGNAANANINLTQAALSWILPNKFRAGQTMDDSDMKYQHRGHAKYVEIAYLFGWGALSNFWYSVNVDYEHGISYPINTDPTDSRILRMSKAAGVDLRPLLHMWGVHPVNAANLKASIQNAGLKPSVLIYNRLKAYQGIVPLTLTQFRSNYNKVHGTLSATDKAWYEDMYNNYTADIGYASIAELQSIIDLYFPDGPPVTTKWNGAVNATWNTTTMNWTAVPGGNATNYVDASPGDGVLFDDTLTANPAITLNTTVSPSGVLFSNNVTAYSLAGAGQIAGLGPLTKEGTGSVTLSGTHTFSGGISVNEGELIVATGGSCANSDLRVLAGATNGVQILAANGQWTCGNLNSYAGSYLDFNFGSVPPSTTTAPLQVNGNLTLTGAKIIVRSAGTLALGQYPLIKYTNTLSGTVPLSVFSLPALPPGASGLIVNNVGNQSIDLLVTILTPLKWAVGNGLWDINTSPNWSSNGVTGLTYSDGKQVIFDDTASGVSPILVTNAVTVSPNSVIANLTNKSYTISGSPITGSASVIKDGPGTLTLSGNNSYTGGTTVSDGTLKLGAANTLGGGTVTVQNGATLDLNGFGLTNKVGGYVIHITGNGVGSAGALVDNAGSQLNFGLTNLTLDADASVGGSSRFDMRPVTASTLIPTLDLAGHTLTKVGVNQFWLQQANVTQGDIVVQSGVLGLNTISITSGLITVKSGAELRLFRNASTTSCELTRPITLEAGAVVAYTGTETTDAIDESIASDIILNGDATVIAGNSGGNSFGSVFELAGSITGLFGWTKSGTNTVLLTGANTYSGTTTVSAGTLRVGATNCIPDGSNDLSDDDSATNGNVSVLAGATFDLNAFDTTIAGLNGAGVVDTLAGGVPMLTIGNNYQDGAFSGVLKNSGGTLALTKVGAGTQTLSGANTYTGGTQVSAGTLLVNNASGSGTGTGDVTVDGDATLGGNGSISGAVSISFGGTLSPGTSIGRLTINSNLTLQGTVLMEIARNGPALTNDLVTGIKTNFYDGTLIITNVGSSPLQVGDSFQLFNAAKYAGGFADIIYPDGYTFTDTLAVDGRITVASVVSSAPPGFPAGAISVLPDHRISLTATGALGATFSLWATTNLALTPVTNTWTLVTNGTVSESPFTIFDTAATNLPARFYQFTTP